MNNGDEILYLKSPRDYFSLEVMMTLQMIYRSIYHCRSLDPSVGLLIGRRKSYDNRVIYRKAVPLISAWLWPTIIC